MKLRSLDVDAFLRRFTEGKTVLKLAKHKVVYAQGDRAETVYFIQKGRVKRNVVSPTGKEAVVAILEAGQFFGEGCLDGQTARSATASTLSEATIVAITKPAMITALRNEPEFNEHFIAWLLHRKARLEEGLIDQLFNFSEHRLARLLLILAHVDSDDTIEPVEIDIDQATLAEMIGTTRSRVSHFMNKFRRLGFISYDGKIHVHRSLLDAVRHDSPALRMSGNERV